MIRNRILQGYFNGMNALAVSQALAVPIGHVEAVIAQHHAEHAQRLPTLATPSLAPRPVGSQREGVNRERINAVLDAYVAGKSEIVIATELRVTPSVVRGITTAFRDSQRKQRAEERAKRVQRRREEGAARQADRFSHNLPTPEEIAERCEEIQRGWTRTQRRLRYLMARTIDSVKEIDGGYWSTPEMRCVDFCEG